MSEAEHEELRVVFVGNSYLYFNDTPQILARLVPGLEYEQVTPGGQTFQGHLADPRLELMLTGSGSASSSIRRSKGETTFFADGGGWDILVLQDHSCHMGGATNALTGENTRESSLGAIAGLAALVKAGAAKMRRKPRVLLFAGWAHRNGAAYDHFKESYPDFETHHARNGEGILLYMDALREALGEDIPVDCVRAGDAFAAVRAVDRSLYDSLFVPDNLHPSRAGSYLASWVAVPHLVQGRRSLEESVVASYTPSDADMDRRLHCDSRQEPPWEPSDVYQCDKWPEVTPVCIDDALAVRLRTFAASVA